MVLFGLFDNKNNNDEDEERKKKLSIRRNKESSQQLLQHADSLTTNSDTKSTASSSSRRAIANSFVAGWTAGVTGTLAGHPLDSIKVWVQTGIRPSADKNKNNKKVSSSLSSGAGVWNTVRRLYAGVTGPIITVGLIQSINFTVYDSTRRFWYYHYDNPSADPQGAEKHAYLRNDSYTSIAVAGFAAGAVLSLITSPMYMVKTMQQTTHPSLKFQDALRMVRAHPGTGFGVHFAVETLNRSVYFCTYEYFKRYFEQEQGEQQGYSDSDSDQEEPKISLTGRMIGAAAAGINCWAWIYPIDALRSRIYANMTSDASIRSAGQMTRIMYAEGGWRSFYRGFFITTMRAGPVAAAILPVYDYVLETLNRMS